MQEFQTLNNTLYFIFVFICQFMAIVQIFVLNTQKARQKYRAILPLYYTFLTCLAFMIVIMSTSKAWYFSFLSSTMWVVILVLTIKTYKLAKYKEIFQANKVKKKCMLDVVLYFAFMLLGL